MGIPPAAPSPLSQTHDPAAHTGPPEFRRPYPPTDMRRGSPPASQHPPTFRASAYVEATGTARKRGKHAASKKHTSVGAAHTAEDAGQLAGRGGAVAATAPATRASVVARWGQATATTKPSAALRHGRAARSPRRHRRGAPVRWQRGVARPPRRRAPAWWQGGVARPPRRHRRRAPARW